MLCREDGTHRTLELPTHAVDGFRHFTAVPLCTQCLRGILAAPEGSYVMAAHGPTILPPGETKEG